IIARERSTLFVPELAIQLAQVRQRLEHPAAEVRALVELALQQARDDGNLHQELCALEAWLTLVDPDDGQARSACGRLLGEVGHSDAPVLVRWRTLLDRCLPRTADLEE